MDPTIIKDYELTLRELTFNSKSIIDVLTTIADENKLEAQGIVRAITERITKCIPEQKLYTLYLLDSICKVVGLPYHTMFGNEIFRIFTEIYLLVNDQTRAKLVKLFETWKILKAKNSTLPLFPEDQLEKIGNFLRQAKPRVAESLQGGIVQLSLVADISSLLPIMEQRGHSDPSDASIPQKISALRELKLILLLQQFGQPELAGIQARLTQMKTQIAQDSQANAIVPSNANNSESTPKFTSSQSAPAKSEATAPEPAKPVATVLFQNLISSGLVKVDQSLKKDSKPEYELVLPKHKYSPQSFNTSSASILSNMIQDANMSQLPQHEQIKYKELLKLERKLGTVESFSSNLQNFILNNTLDASTVQVLYETKSLKCSQCGKRFPSDDRGTAMKKLHLDWHFRINKRLSNHKTNVQSRSWYLDTAQWVQFQENELSEFEPSTVKKDVNTRATSTEVAFVVIPSDETNMNNVCAICREHIKPSINPATEEWVWNECMLAPGNNSGRKIVHVSCFEEANRKRGAENDGNGRVKRERFA
ncbi:hypothetical protein PUMCH_002104 [Australozyma saopauloensis]|uniref:CID domain-containing protein n=1 Tax=Australozyma saopauloensis TaxID=291208 RepID=A0AAX4H8J1_9ASCO|nr:hypothetical protein PUMCH_002104 [[Candida] saopauloensis]